MEQLVIQFWVPIYWNHLNYSDFWDIQTRSKHERPFQVKLVFWLSTRQMLFLGSTCQQCLTIIPPKLGWGSNFVPDWLLFIRSMTTEREKLSLLIFGIRQGRWRYCRTLATTINFKPNLSGRLWQIATSIVSKYGEEMVGGWEVYKTSFPGHFPPLFLRYGSRKLWQYWRKMVEGGKCDIYRHLVIWQLSGQAP